MTILICKVCGKEYSRKPSYIKKHGSSYCSKICQNKDALVVLSGEGNPNFKNAGIKICHYCGKEFKSYNKDRKYCSSHCYNKSKCVLAQKECKYCKKMFQPNTKKRIYCSIECSKLDRIKRKVIEKKKKTRTTKDIKCQNCGIWLEVPKNSTRKFCSYKCFVDNGGPKKAGEAAVMARVRYGQKKDANHKEIFEAIRKITAAYDLSTASFGVPDGIAWINGGWHLFDVKNPKTSYGRRGLNVVQKKWSLKWNGGPVFLIHSIDEAISFAQGKFDGLKVFPDNHMGAKEYGNLF